MAKEDSDNSYSMTDEEYTRMRKAEDSSYEYHGEESDETNKENEDDGYPKTVEHDESGVVYDLKTDFIVLLPGEIIRIPQTSNLSWMTMFYALPRELVEKRPAYMKLPRNIVKLMELSGTIPAMIGHGLDSYILRAGRNKDLIAAKSEK